MYSVFRLSIHPWVRDSYSYYVYPLIPFLILFLKTGAIWIQDRTDKSKTKFPSSASKEKNSFSF
ncbi:membrane protein, PF09852 family [Leptospira borgpetersenii str. 200701203]|uniref:Membrane protein, PF09852 family n=1 Tax=Leptospira borgpetersenii str. 200701203 TaxID=1193007 RepID=M3H2N8_LEPBO|nr:membrane protein, PF09852 family [Leptospira borgpetersenii str. 200701203]